MAKRKRTRVSGRLEEMILHRNVGVEPHRHTTIHYLQELTKKDGLDYDSRASYRFAEK